MKWLFWICVFGCVYSYAIYPLLLSVVVPKRRPASGKIADTLKVSLVIACRNEAGRLRHKLENALQLHYPNLDIMVASDASDDGSDELVLEFASRGVRLVRSPERRGKEHAQGLAIARAQGDLVVFSDAGTDLPADSIGFIADRFRDPGVGAVSSEDLFIGSDGKLAGEGAYVRYEMWLRRLESERAGLVGLSGSFFAVRRSVLTTWDATIPSDFACALMTVRAGKVAVSDPRVRGIYKDIKDPSKEYQRKVRTAIRGMTGLAKLARVLNPFRYGVFAFQVWSHKVMRWLVPWFLLGTLIGAAALQSAGGIYRLAFWLQVTGYALVALAHFAARFRDIGPVRIGYYFIQANLALAHAAVQFAAGKRVVVWNPSIR
jgi:hypothetical protein